MCLDITVLGVASKLEDMLVVLCVYTVSKNIVREAVMATVITQFMERRNELIIRAAYRGKLS